MGNLEKGIGANPYSGSDKKAEENNSEKIERVNRTDSGRIRFDETESFERPGFNGHIYFGDNEGAGFGALEVRVHDSHPEKTVEVETRMYRVEEGNGTFIINGTSYDAKPGDVFLIRRHSTYSYKAHDGMMKLFEINIPYTEKE